jgi:hypothetical protein
VLALLAFCRQNLKWVRVLIIIASSGHLTAEKCRTPEISPLVAAACHDLNPWNYACSDVIIFGGQRQRYVPQRFEMQLEDACDDCPFSSRLFLTIAMYLRQ